jgi:hypothetical protein
VRPIHAAKRMMLQPATHNSTEIDCMWRSLRIFEFQFPVSNPWQAAWPAVLHRHLSPRAHQRLSKRLRTPRLPRLRTYVWIMVVRTSLWPSNSWIVRMSYPDSGRDVAKLRRSVWQLAVPGGHRTVSVSRNRMTGRSAELTSTGAAVATPRSFRLSSSGLIIENGLKSR